MARVSLISPSSHPSLYDTTACCVVGGRAWNSLREPGPREHRLVFRKRVSIAVGRGGEHHHAKLAVEGGVMRSGSGMNSSVRARPPGARAAYALAANCSQAGTSK